MDDLIQRQENYPALLDSYVQQGRMFLFNAAQNLIQYGRVLVEAKPYVPRGQFEKWVQESFGMSERTAQQYMAVWRRFGGNEQMQSIQFSNLQKMLALPEGEETRFAEEHDLKNMTAREVEKAVQKVKADSREAINKERKARLAAELRARELEQEKGQRPESTDAALMEKDAEIEKYRKLAEQYQAEAENAQMDRRAAMEALNQTKQDLREAEEMLSENQQAYDRMQSELLNAQSMMARGDAERVISDQLTVEDFSASVRLFLGSTAQMPYMGSTFAQMVDAREYRQWNELMLAMEDWAKKARQALDTVELKGEIVNG